MYNNSAYWKDSRLVIKDKTHDLFVSSCGNYKLLSKSILPTSRPRGRLDYQLLYIASGKAHFYFDGQKQIITAGHVILYRPREAQRYYYYLKDDPNVFWVHFTGSNVKNILKEYNVFQQNHTMYIGMNHQVNYIFNAMIQELLLCKQSYEEMLVHFLRMLFVIIRRSTNAPSGTRELRMNKEIENAISYFNMHYNEPLNIDLYSKKHGMSPCWFIRKFKEQLNDTPMQYIVNLRISTAQSLLENTDYNISEISNLVGYSNPLYFSRIFRQRVGISPSKYRNKFNEMI